MTRLASLLIVPAALFALSACADQYGYTYGGGVTPYYYDGFYDNYYGPVISGYWSADQFFYYQRGRGQPYVRDEGRHFRRDGGNGFQPFHMRDLGDHQHHEHPQQHPSAGEDHRGDRH